MTFRSNPRLRATGRAFTLIETVLAIGIVSFAFVALMGLLPCGLQVFRKAMDTGRTKYAGQVLTTRSVRRNGDRLYVDLSFSLVRDDAGTVTGALAIARDCTARRQADNALQARAVELEKRLRAAGLDAS